MLFRNITFAFALLFATSSNAATFYVAGNGSGSTCSAAAPCPTIFIAMSVVGAGDTVVCVSPPGASAIPITKSVTIDCSTARAAVRDAAVPPNGNSGLNGVVINISASDPYQTVRLRGLDVDGLGPSARFYDRGIVIQAAGAVHIEDCIISNAKQQGILDERTGGQTRLYIKDSIVSGNVGAGIVAVSAATGITELDNVRSENNAYGLAAAAGNSVVINRSVLSGNSNAGVEGDSGAQIVVNNSTIGHNNIGVQSSSSVRLSNNDIAFNNTALSGVSGTFGNNRFSGNGTLGTPPTALGGASSDLGQQ